MMKIVSALVINMDDKIIFFTFKFCHHAFLFIIYYIYRVMPSNVLFAVS